MYHIPQPRWNQVALFDLAKGISTAFDRPPAPSLT